MNLSGKNTVHLLIDGQSCFYLKDSARYGEDLLAFPEIVDAFSRELEERGIETIHVAYNLSDVSAGFYDLASRESAEPAAGAPIYPTDKKSLYMEKNDFAVHILNRLTYKKPYYPKTGKLFVKDTDNAFADGQLEKILIEKGIQNVIFSGINATACVLRSIYGALGLEDLSIYVALDCLADTNGYPLEGHPLDPKVNDYNLTKHLSAEQRSRVRIYDTDQIISMASPVLPAVSRHFPSIAQMHKGLLHAVP